MSAKHAKKSGAKNPAPSVPAAAPAPVAGGAAATMPEPAAASWLESADPRRRLFGKVLLVALWLYVGALWLLALDQTFDWGIFGPKTPPS